MDFFSGVAFFIMLAIALTPPIIFGGFKIGQKYFGIYRSAITIFFIYLAFKDSKIELLMFVAYVIFSLLIVKSFLFLHRKYGRNNFIYYSALILTIVPLALAKFHVSFNGHIFGFLGISYIFFRVIHVMIEVHDDLIKEINTRCFFDFLAFFPSISSGPIDRYRRFEKDFNYNYSRNEYNLLVENGVVKLVVGVFIKLYYLGYVFIT